MLCYCFLRVLRHFVHWNGCKAMLFTVLCCNSILLCNSVCADRSGMVAPRLEWCLFCSRVLRFWSCFVVELLHHGCDLSVTICTKHCVFLGQRRFRCGEKLTRARDGLRRRRFAVESCSWGSQVTFSLLCGCCAIVFCMCWDILCALELVHQSDVFYSNVLQSLILDRIGTATTSWVRSER